MFASLRHLSLPVLLSVLLSLLSPPSALPLLGLLALLPLLSRSFCSLLSQLSAVCSLPFLLSSLCALHSRNESALEITLIVVDEILRFIEMVLGCEIDFKISEI